MCVGEGRGQIGQSCATDRQQRQHVPRDANTSKAFSMSASVSLEAICDEAGGGEIECGNGK